MVVWTTERTCVGVHLWLSVPAHYTAWSVTGVYTGELWTCLILQLIKSTRDLFPCGHASGPHINMSLFSRQEKQEERNRQRRGRRRGGDGRGGGRTSGGRQKQAGEAQTNECTKRPVWSIWQQNKTSLCSLLWWANWMAKASSVFVGCSKSMCDPSDGSPRRAVDLGKRKKEKEWKAQQTLYTFSEQVSQMLKTSPLWMSLLTSTAGTCVGINVERGPQGRLKKRRKKEESQSEECMPACEVVVCSELNPMTLTSLLLGL